MKREDQKAVEPEDQLLGSAQNHQHDLASGLDGKAYKRALRKLDLFLLPTVTFIYFLNFLDRECSPGAWSRYGNHRLMCRVQHWQCATSRSADRPRPDKHPVLYCAHRHLCSLHRRRTAADAGAQENVSVRYSEGYVRSSDLYL